METQFSEENKESNIFEVDNNYGNRTETLNKTKYNSQSDAKKSHRLHVRDLKYIIINKLYFLVVFLM